MFGDNILIGKSIHNMQDKNRIILPKNSMAENEDTLCFIRENELTFSIYNLKTIEEQIKRLEKLKNSSNIDEINKIEEAINRLTFSIIGTNDVDKQNRVTIPKMVVNEYDLDGQLIFQGSNDHIKVFNDEEKYQEYQKRIENKK